MAEISYPFNADNATTGAAKAVSETRWQSMAHMWGGDRVDFILPAGATSYASMPFTMKVNNVTSIQVGVGKAWVGGFYYELTSAMNLTIAANTSTTGRLDLIVVRLDMAKPSVNLAVRKGTNAATPLLPQPVRQPGGVWELPLAQVTVPANGGALSIGVRQPFNMPPNVAFPWNAPEAMALTPPTTFGYDVDSNTNGHQNEYYNGRTGPIITRTMDGTSTFTPALINDSNLPSTNITYKGQWRWIAPGTVSFSLSVHSSNPTMSTDNQVAYGIRLPVPASTSIRQVFNGTLNNPFLTGGYPSFTSLTGFTGSGVASSYFSIYLPSPGASTEGLDNFRMFPNGSTIYFSGTYEANTFD